MTAPDCPSRETCPVPDPSDIDLRALRLARLPSGTRFQRVHQQHRGAAEFNRSGLGSSRFAPLPDAGHVYLAASQTAALLETVFHDVMPGTPRIIYVGIDLFGWQLTEVRLERDVAVLDLRDQQLRRLGLERGQIVATTPAHYPCTRQWAVALAERRPGGVAATGMLWNSRVAELATGRSPLLGDLLPGRRSEVCVLYDHHLDDDALWPVGPTFPDLADGQGRLLAEQIADHIDAEIH